MSRWGGLEHRLMKGCPHNGRLEIFNHQPPRHAAEVLEGMAVTAEPGGDFLIKYELHVLMAAPREGHHEGPRLLDNPISRVEQASGGPEIDLRFLAWRGLDPDAGRRGRGLQGTHEPPQRAVAPGEPRLFPQALEDGPAFHALSAECENALPIRSGDE